MHKLGFGSFKKFGSRVLEPTSELRRLWSESSLGTYGNTSSIKKTILGTSTQNSCEKQSAKVTLVRNNGCTSPKYKLYSIISLRSKTVPVETVWKIQYGIPRYSYHMADWIFAYY